MSMGASEYLQARMEGGEKKPAKASIYTGSAYIITVVLLILPFLLLDDLYIALLWTVLNAVIVILVFTYYISVAKDLPFKSRFLEMVTLSLGIAGISFLIGFLVRLAFGIEI
jgi:vacuolar iron transporter family protein